MATAITKALKEGAATNRSTSAPPINTLPACPRLSGIKRRLPDAPTPAKAAWADAGEDAPTPMVIDFDASLTGGGGAVAVAGTSHAGVCLEPKLWARVCVCTYSRIADC